MRKLFDKYHGLVMTLITGLATAGFIYGTTVTELKNTKNEVDTVGKKFDRLKDSVTENREEQLKKDAQITAALERLMVQSKYTTESIKNITEELKELRKK